MLHGSTDSPAVEMRRKAGPVLGLHNTLEFYPFMKLKTWQERWVALLEVIPQKQEVLRYGYHVLSKSIVSDISVAPDRIYKHVAILLTIVLSLLDISPHMEPRYIP
jgi:hypothetical protein